MTRTCCRGCIHRRELHKGDGAKVCCYALDTGRLRGCEPEECTHYNSKRRDLKELQRRNKEYDMALAFGLEATYNYYDN